MGILPRRGLDLIRRRLSRLALSRRDIDRWAVVYLLASGLYPFLGASPPSGPWPGFLLHSGLALAIWFLPPLARRSPFAALRLLGETYLPFIFPLFYSEMAHLGLVFYHQPLDPAFIRLEESLLGGQPSLGWSTTWPWPWLHELLQLAYFSYYVWGFVVLALLLASPAVPAPRRWPAMLAFVRDLSATMLVCYTLYTFFPVWGPKYFRAGPVEVEGWIFTRLMRQIHEHGAILGAAFPSSHVAATLVPWWHAWKNVPCLRAWATLQLVLVAMATVYCRYHYVVDVLGGLLLGGIILVLGEKYGEREKRQGSLRSGPGPAAI